MRVVPGTRFGPYEIIAPLGAGGMGEVYRARDSRLGREVAVKSLPPAFAADAERIARFEREARLLATLNHPSIATIYGLEVTDSTPLIVLELLEGGSLAEQLRSGPLPVRGALAIARDVADALHAAHERGIVHRDLKPANIALTKAGKPKVLDFGLAKAVVADSAATTLDGATHAGAVLGTVAYMSPEQARGIPVDKRADIWAFGCVLYEMLTGRAPFSGPSASDIVAAILQREPDLTLLPSDTPSGVRRLLRRCLEKDLTRRLHDMADARIELDEALTTPDSSADRVMVAAEPRRRRISLREAAAWTIAAGAIAAAVFMLAVRQDRPADLAGTRDPFRASILLPTDLRLTMPDPAARFAVSPDGRRLVLVAASATGVPMLWVRPLDSTTAQPIPGTEGASYPFWSPDSRSIAFIARGGPVSWLGPGGRLRKVDLSGGEPVTIAETGFNAPGAWGTNNTVLFTPTGNSPLVRISASSPASLQPVTALDAASGDVQHSFPSFLPDGRHFLYTVIGSTTGVNEARAVYIASLDDGSTARLLIDRASHGTYASGRVLFLRDATLLAQRLNLDTLQVEGDPVVIAEGVQITARVSGGTGAFSVSNNGVLVYQTGVGLRSQLLWADRAGRLIAPLGEPGDYVDAALSPDGSRVLISAVDPQVGTRDLLMMDMRGVSDRFTSTPSDDYAPVWSPDGSRVAYTSAREGSIAIYERPVSGLGAERRIDSGGSRLGMFAATWSPGGDLLFIAGGRAIARSDIHAVRMEQGGSPRPLLESPAVDTQVRFHPSGQWIAYAASEQGRLEVYVMPYPGPGERKRVSIAGGGWPRWNHDGRELFYLVQGSTTTDYTMMVAPVTITGATIAIGDSTKLFDVRLRPMGRLDAYPYEVTPDGKRFLLNGFLEEATSTGLTLIVNWPEEHR